MFLFATPANRLFPLYLAMLALVACRPGPSCDRRM